MKTENGKDTFYRISGILGLLLLLALFIWLDHPVKKGNSITEAHNHADPFQHGAGVKKSEISKTENSTLKPSGKLVNGKRVVEYEAFQYGFAPDPLVVKSGETVVLTVKSRDVKHGMMIPEIDFSADITKKSSQVSFIAPAHSGKYGIFCNVYCGAGHGDMKGTLIVLPKGKKDTGHDH